MSFVIGIDVGTSSARALLINEKGKVIASAVKAYPLSTPRPGWSEQDPEDWWAATVATVNGVLAKSGVDRGEIRGVGLSGQMHGSVFLDESNAVLRPAILWNDQRTAEECAEITEKV